MKSHKRNPEATLKILGFSAAYVYTSVLYFLYKQQGHTLNSVFVSLSSSVPTCVSLNALPILHSAEELSRDYFQADVSVYCQKTLLIATKYLTKLPEEKIFFSMEIFRYHFFSGRIFFSEKA